MNTRLSLHPRQRNPRLNAVARSALTGGMNTTLITEPESAGTMISGNQDNTNKLDSIHKLLLSTNEKVDSLTAEIETITKNMGVMENVDETVLAQTEVKGVMEKENFSAGAGLGIDLSSLTEKAFVSGKRHPKISSLINGYIKKPRFTSVNPVKIAENSAKPGWSLTSNFDDGYNHALAMTLTSYLRDQKDSKAVPTSDLGRMVKNHFRNQVREFRVSPDKAASRQRSAQRRS
ncbi:hypothetical protein CLU79DRAFT_720589 [Phycomyces nitens]|nr:hypothetical protein CLU79DRAFT_720589 [Phycomyces nitens]